jgi:hypothetical protein
MDKLAQAKLLQQNAARFRAYALLDHPQRDMWLSRAKAASGHAAALLRQVKEEKAR